MNQEKDQEKESTHFGFTKIPTSEKTGRVAEVFNSVAGKYDLMNDLMSLGTHRVMKQMTCDATRARTGHTILDLAGGTGDLALRLTDLVGETGHICLCDINGSMLDKGRDKLTNHGVVGNVSFVQADGEKLPFPAETFNAITIAFGLRNITAKETALKSMFESLKPGGRLVILEFSKPRHPVVKGLYQRFNKLWPQIGKAITGDPESYQYLVESIEMHPDQQTLADMITTAGFSRVKYQNLLNGVAAIHEGVKSRP